MQKTEIRSVCALSRLCFILAVATLYVTAQGVDVVTSGQCRRVDPHWFRGNSKPERLLSKWFDRSTGL